MHDYRQTSYIFHDLWTCFHIQEMIDFWNQLVHIKPLTPCYYSVTMLTYINIIIFRFMLKLKAIIHSLKRYTFPLKQWVNVERTQTERTVSTLWTKSCEHLWTVNNEQTQSANASKKWTVNAWWTICECKIKKIIWSASVVILALRLVA